MEPFTRPAPPSSPADRLRSWIVWFGVGRLVAATVATAVVVAGGVWLLRSPAPSTEASLPMATTTTAPPTTLAAATPASSAVPERSVAIVHVAGAVVEPGVYELAADARIRDALVAAGGPTPAADWNALNLASPLSDGMRVYVPTVGESPPGALVSGGVPPPSAGDAVVPVGPIDLNRATAGELDVLPGVGPATAAAIVDERDRNGPFATVEDLERVPGIGPAKLAALRDLVTT